MEKRPFIECNQLFALRLDLCVTALHIFSWIWIVWRGLLNGNCRWSGETMIVNHITFFVHCRQSRIGGTGFSGWTRFKFFLGKPTIIMIGFIIHYITALLARINIYDCMFLIMCCWKDSPWCFSLISDVFPLFVVAECLSSDIFSLTWRQMLVLLNSSDMLILDDDPPLQLLFWPIPMWWLYSGGGSLRNR